MSLSHQNQFFNMIFREKGVKNVNELGLELYLDINLEEYENYGNAHTVYPEKELIGKTDIFVIQCDDIITNKFIYTHAPIMLEVTQSEENDHLLLNEQKYRAGAVEISSTMENLPEGITETLVYHIESTLNGETNYSNVVSVTFDKSGEQIITVEGIAVESEVTITQIYSGASSECTTDYVVDGVVSGDDIISMSFTNGYNGYKRKGGSVQHNFTYTNNKWNRTDKVNNINGFSLQLSEDFNNLTENISIVSNGNNEPVYVRAIAFAPSNMEAVYSDDAYCWQIGLDGYYDFSDILESGATTEKLNIEIQELPIPESPMEGDKFNVIIVYEVVPVQYDGSEAYADWWAINDYDENIEY